MEKRTEKHLDALRDARNRELKAVGALGPGFSCQGSVGEFIGIYIQSEVFARKLQLYYRTDTKKSGNDDLNITVLNAALKHFKLSFPKSDVSSLFKGGTGKRGEKSARQLRNGYLHTLSLDDKEEIMSKAKSFIPKLLKFISNELKET